MSMSLSNPQRHELEKALRTRNVTLIDFRNNHLTIGYEAFSDTYNHEGEIIFAEVSE